MSVTNSYLPSVGARDMRDLKGVSRSPAMALLQRLTVPAAPRPKDKPSAPGVEAAEQAAFQALRTFAPSDYVKWVYQYFRFRIGPRHRFLTYEGKQPSDGIYSLEGEDDEIRIGVAGDWGTGTDEAHRIASLIANAKPHYTIHLGDVYFVGDSSEVRENFLGQRRNSRGYTPCQWPIGSKASFALNGNHEMYARGIAYFDEILPAMGTGG